MLESNLINGVVFDGSSYRIAWVRSRLQREKILDIGVGTQEYGFEDTVHFDMDKYHHEVFIQGDAHRLPFKDGAFDTVLISDVIEHVVNPTQVCKEATRVCRRLILSIFEEWRLGGEGQHIEVGREKYERPPDDPSIIAKVPEEVISHAPHIWQFTDKLIKDLIWSTQWKIVEFCKEPECVHEEHLWWNWLIVLKKPEVGDRVEYPGDPANFLPAALVLKQFSYKR